MYALITESKDRNTMTYLNYAKIGFYSKSKIAKTFYDCNFLDFLHLFSYKNDNNKKIL